MLAPPTEKAGSCHWTISRLTSDGLDGVMRDLHLIFLGRGLFFTGLTQVGRRVRFGVNYRRGRGGIGGDGASARPGRRCGRGNGRIGTDR
jgi:hypothetical protein